jgi:hypothetical protein
MTVMMRDKRNVEIKWSQVDTRSPGWQRRENNGDECGNPNNCADLSHGRHLKKP